MEIDSEPARRPGGRYHIGDEFGADRHARRNFSILSGVAVVGNDSRDAFRRRATKGVEHEQQLDQVVVYRGTGGLNHEDVPAADVLFDFDHNLTVAESAHVGRTTTHTNVRADCVGQRWVGVPGEYFNLVLHAFGSRLILHGRDWAGRIRTFDTGSKVRGLTAWRPPIIQPRRATSPGCELLAPTIPVDAAAPPQLVPTQHLTRLRIRPSRFLSSAHPMHLAP